MSTLIFEDGPSALLCVSWPRDNFMVIHTNPVSVYCEDTLHEKCGDTYVSAAAQRANIDYRYGCQDFYVESVEEAVNLHKKLIDSTYFKDFIDLLNDQKISEKTKKKIRRQLREEFGQPIWWAPMWFGIGVLITASIAYVNM